MWSPDLFLEKMYEDNKQVREKRIYDFKWKQSTIQRFKALLGEFPPSTLNQHLIVLEEVKGNGFSRLRIEIETLPSLKMPVYVLIPDGAMKPSPAVMVLHGHGYGSKEVVGLTPDGSPIKGESGIHNDIGIKLVEQGLVVVVPEIIGFGERKLIKDSHTDPTANSCFALASQLLLYGKTLPGLRIYEAMRVLDYMSGIPEININKIGCYGFSGGGLLAAFTSIFESRIKATVISGYTNIFKGSIMDRNHCLDNYIPSILNYCEMPELIALNVPKPIFIETGLNDKVFPSIYARKAHSVIKNIYSTFGTGENVEFHAFEGGHEISGEKSVHWLIDKL